MIQNLTYELSVLAKAVQHKNLSAAAIHVGLSQPQLSRLVAKVESELNVILLDRTARRKSGWTNMAQQLAITFEKGLSRLETDIRSLAQDFESQELHIGTLEGLSEIAMTFAKNCFDKLSIRHIYLDVYEFKDLDAHFLSGNLDLVFTVKPPSKQKFNHILEVGYQQLERVTTDKDLFVVSPFDFVGSQKKEFENKKTLISNSLRIREFWLKEIGGTGNLPVGAKTGRGKGQFTVYLIGHDLLSPSLWKGISDSF